MKGLEQRCRDFFAQADIQINGSRTWDLQVYDKRVFSRLVADRSLGLAESYMDGLCDCQNWEEFFKRGFQAGLREKAVGWKMKLGFGVSFIADLLRNPQSLRRSVRVAQNHYDLGNDFYELVLDKQMQYTCGYWDNVDNLDQAQDKKLRVVCEKLHLQPGMNVLELGGGWGGLARVIAERGCNVISYNISHEQVEYARQICRGLPVTIVEADYRKARELKLKFDRVVSVGLMEHVGYKNYRGFFDLISNSLNDNSIALVHTIGKPKPNRFKDPFIRKYIFPGGEIPAFSELIVGAEQSGLELQDVENLKQYYVRTIGAWYKNFSRNWDKIKELDFRFDERFRRMFGIFYLLGCKAAFEYGNLQLWQTVFSKGKLNEVYRRS